MEYNNPYIKVVWEDTPENITQERIKRVKEYFKNKYNAKDVKVITSIYGGKSSVKMSSLEIGNNITDPQYQKNLMKEYIKEMNIPVSWEMIDRLDNRINGDLSIDQQTSQRQSKWYVKKVEFSNFLSFGDGNVIDFTEFNGITTIESLPRNFGGKSTSSVDLLMYLFFGTTTKTKTSIEIFNRFRDENTVWVKGLVTIDGDDYVIERRVERKKSKSGDYNVKNVLDFYRVLPDGTLDNLEGEQKRETEKIITNAIGREEDFLSTILTTGGNLEDMIEAKPTARGAVLTRFLGLENLKLKEEKCKSIYNEWTKKLVSNTNNVVQLESDNVKYTEEISSTRGKLDNMNGEILDLQGRFNDYKERRDKLMLSKNKDVDQELIRVNPTLLQREIDELVTKQDGLRVIGRSITVIEPTEYYNEIEHSSVTKNLNEYLVKHRVAEGECNRLSKLLKDFKEGKICPTCKRPMEETDHSVEIAETEDLVKKSQKERDDLFQKIVEIRKDDEVHVLKKRIYDEYEKSKIRKEKNELEVDQLEISIQKKRDRMNNYERNKKWLDENQKIEGEILILNTKIETVTGDIRRLTVSIEQSKNLILNLEEKIDINNKLIKKIKTEEEHIFIFKTYLNVFGKNGISKGIMKNMIPLINQELHRLLSDSCYFTLEMNINERNEVEFLMIDNETRVVKPINSGSGYEKTIAALAIRSILTKVSSLPKPNIVVMDEVFGKIADENLELVGEFFKKIKNYFEHILVISHNPLIRNWSDNLIMVSKEENISHIESITKKIT